MKHTLKVTIALVLFFFMAQFTGLFIINHYIDHVKTSEAKETIFKPLPYGFERPEVENQSTSFIYILISVLIGTFFILMLIKLKKQFIWRAIFFIAVLISLSIAFAAFISPIAAAIIAFIIAALRIYKPNIIVQNLSELFVYGGLVASVINIFNLFAVFALLILISIYDFVAVFKTKHMIKLAKFQTNSKVFAGLLIPYEKSKMSIGQKQSADEETAEAKTAKSRVAVLGGGDIGFPLLFAGVVMKELMLQEPVLFGFLKTLIIPFFVSLALLFILVKGQENKFYPAMPVLSLGCFIGYFVVLLV